jgi:transposase
MNSRLFEFWFMLLLKVIPRGSVVIMDNASFHRKKVLKKMAKAARCRVIFLPAYSPDFSPIEHLWANLKSWLAHHAKNFSLLSDAIFHYFQSG